MRDYYFNLKWDLEFKFLQNENKNLEKYQLNEVNNVIDWRIGNKKLKSGKITIQLEIENYTKPSKNYWTFECGLCDQSLIKDL